MFKLKIKTDNAAFDDGNRATEVARILRELAGRLESSNSIDGHIVLRDVNGNIVGAADGEEPDDDETA